MKQLLATTLLILSIAFTASSNAQTQPSFEFFNMKLKVNPANESSLLSLLEQVADSLPTDIKMTLSEMIFIANDATHQLNFSSREGENLTELMSSENNSARLNFIHALRNLVEVKQTVRGVRLFHFGGKNVRPDTKKISTYYAYWQVNSAKPEKTVSMFQDFAKEFAHLRKDNSVGLGQNIAGANASTHYYLHTFDNYKEYVEIMNTYMTSEKFQKHVEVTKSFETPVENGLVKVLKQWN
ncbi:MAG TPA: hypothetical protein DCR17_12895 [Verrucomicrobiales bacterium]|mgnify:FL=1|nr:hypothetical protein [Verrucomicrobiales bacterium]HCP37168.1 hypothetical protein [Verrucomicrobiales bacterium]HCZ05367.1 hypothetical protein [Verrucomicrobiales bacterium]|tara:strand:+ start:573 stop:1292 length:720 start_codon:yes stop_codon:yes gene_type:complete